METILSADGRWRRLQAIIQPQFDCSNRRSASYNTITIRLLKQKECKLQYNHNLTAQTEGVQAIIQPQFDCSNRRSASYKTTTIWLLTEGVQAIIQPQFDWSNRRSTRQKPNREKIIWIIYLFYPCYVQMLIVLAVFL